MFECGSIATEVTNQEFQKKGSEVYEDWKVSLRWIKDSVAYHLLYLGKNGYKGTCVMTCL